MSGTFKAILISRDEEKKQSVEMTEVNVDDLMEGDVTVAVEATTVNYKDGLAITGKSPVVRHWPMIPGIDFAGKVTASDNADFAVGDEVVLNGWGVGESHWGGYAQIARVKGDWLIKRPSGISAKQAMSIGTAGYTSMLCIMALERAGITPDKGPILVTGSNGGVGSVAISILSKLGYEVLAATRRTEEADFLKSLGASDIVDAADLSEAGRPMGKERWAGAVDAVGSHTLANVLAQTKYGGAVAACGLAQGYDLPATVMPFILRGVSLLGVDSVMAPKALRQEAWSRLEKDLDLAKLESLSTEIAFDDLIAAANDIVEGKIRGRVVATI
ncbi:MAG: oxidoreductase [Hyphomicrobiales bacterium]|nr:MAG: oxidoreductase [Hyphomicrobiales bacterium]